VSLTNVIVTLNAKLLQRSKPSFERPVTDQGQILWILTQAVFARVIRPEEEMNPCSSTTAALLQTDGAKTVATLLGLS
jgi:hypothetical protein